MYVNSYRRVAWASVALRRRNCSAAVRRRCGADWRLQLAINDLWAVNSRSVRHLFTGRLRCGGTAQPARAKRDEAARWRAAAVCHGTRTEAKLACCSSLQENDLRDADATASAGCCSPRWASHSLSSPVSFLDSKPCYENHIKLLL